jgi:peptide/nickel transport system permease protein
VGLVILIEASLSFLGAGIPPPDPSWGSMAAEGRDLFKQAWWISLFPSLAIGLVVLAGNFLGDWIRDKMDPRLRQL